MQKFVNILVILLVLFWECHSMTPDVLRRISYLDRDVKQVEEDLKIAKNKTTVIPNVSNQCTWTLGNITNSSSVLVKYIDASGKLPSGIEYGNLLSMGSYGLCESIPTAHYCMVNFRVVFKGKKVPVRWGLCITKKCSESDIAYGLEVIVKDMFHEDQMIIISTKTNPRSVYCAKTSDYSVSAIACLIVCAILCFLCVIGTLLDQFAKPSLTIQSRSVDQGQNQNGFLSKGYHDGDTENLLQSDQLNADNVESTSVQFASRNQNILVKVLLCFSIVRSTKKIMDTNVPAGAISSINGMRVLSITWVILGHTYLTMLMGGIVDNLAFAKEIVHRFTFQAIVNAFLSVDSFFFLSGLLVGYLGLRRMSRNNGHLPLFKFYFHRFWRLTPAYMFVIWFYTTLDPHLNKGPLWFSHQLGNACNQLWWTNLLYINNFYPNELDKECMGWSWYLANDMQFYVISPLLLYVMYRLKKIGLLVGVGGLTLASITVTGVIIGVYDLPTSLEKVIEGKGTKREAMYTNYVYIKPYCRIAPYLVGIALGYVLFMDKQHSFIRKLKPNRRWLFVLIGWMVAVSLGISAVYGMYSQYKENGKPFSKAENIVYGSLFRFAWAVALAWVVYACQTGFGGLVNNILSTRFWIPLSRLTYGTYLVHFIVLGVFFGGFQHEIVYTDILLAFYFVSVVVFSYGAAFILAIAVEFPLMHLEELFLKR